MDWLLDPDVVFLNHGSFGACPRVVHDEYQRIQRHLETQPVRFLQREVPDLLSDARHRLAEFIGATDDDVVFVPNPTYAVNEIARSLQLGPGDEVLTSNHEYGACFNAWTFMAAKSGFEFVTADLPPTIESDDDFTSTIWNGVTQRTKVLFLSHITSATALTFPIAEVCRRATERGIITVIDGAHVAGQMPLDVSDIGADFYVGACHKWMCAPKGASFLYARREIQHLIEPLVVGWGWGDDRQFDSGSDFLDFHEWLGTNDPSAYLAVPTAIRFQRDNDWPSVQARCHELAEAFVAEAASLHGIRRVHSEDRFVQMALLELTDSPRSRSEAAALQRDIYETACVEVPVISWIDAERRPRTFVRVSVQAYNNEHDLEALISALAAHGSTTVA